MKMISFKIQNLVLSENKKLDEYWHLMYRGNQFVYDAINSLYTWNPGDFTEFFTYYNAFALHKWRKYTHAQKIYLCIRCKGNFKLTVFGHYREDGQIKKEWFGSNKFHLNDITDVRFPIPSDAKSEVLGFQFDVLSSEDKDNTDQQFCIESGGWYTDLSEEPINNVNIALVSTTFRDDKFITGNIEMVSENERAARHFDMNILKKQENLESISISDLNATHILFFDAEALILPETLVRTYSILALIKPEFRGKFISGTILDHDRMNLQYNNEGIVREMHLWNNVFENEEDIGMQKKSLSASLFCCLPISNAAKLQLPVSNENGFLTLNGICEQIRDAEKKIKNLGIWRNYLNMAKYDVAIYGLWYGNNYGSIITYYALSKVMQSMGKTFAMIRNPLGRNIDIDSLERSHPLRFAKEKYNITALRPLSRLGELNDYFDAFLIGSDQMWNYHLSRPYKQSYFLDFVHDDKIKAAYAVSFGRSKYLGPDDEKELTRKNLKRFDAISVRDDFSKRICENDFGIHAEPVLDPVFLCDTKYYDELIDESGFRVNEEYIFAYILDPNAMIGSSLEKIVQTSGKKVIVVFNQSGDKNKLWNMLNIQNENVVLNSEPTVQEWLSLFKYADFVVTDSFHGSCFSIIFKKQFIVLKNNGRGGGRFPYLLGKFGLLEHMIEDPSDFAAKYSEFVSSNVQIDYNRISEVMESEKQKSYNWLKKALTPKEDNKAMTTSKPVTVPVNLSPDIERCRLVVSVLKAYGIEDIVISSGARNVSLARYFESNSCFKTYLVTDERSAAYFALGLSVKKNNKPVVITCTSGTAVANYLPGITEAFHQRVPIIIISGDRYPCYMGQMEAQMIDQIGVFNNVCKKSFQLPLNWDNLGKWETRRMVSEAVLECTHFVSGPVHINVPINTLENDPPSPDALALIDVKKINRLDYSSPGLEWEKAAAKLRASQKIMLICGQNNPLSEEDKKYFDAFCSKYNCVALTDHLSNVHNEYCIDPYRLLKRITNDTFKKTLMPDMIIYIGGKRILNCPLITKVKSIVKALPVWHVMEDGSLCDIFRKLTDIIGCSESRFFRYFAEKAGNVQNDMKYFNDWKKAVSSIPPVDWSKVNWSSDKFTSYYTMGRLMTELPKNSMLHLSVGNTFINSRNYPLDPSITVYCNMGTNGIDGSCSSFMGQCAVDNKLGFLIIGDLSFFYDMNALWNKSIGANVRIMLNNDHCAGLLKHYRSPSITQEHGATAEGWIKSLGCFKYICAHDREEFEALLPQFTDSESDEAIFFEVLFDNKS